MKGVEDGKDIEVALLRSTPRFLHILLTQYHVRLKTDHDIDIKRERRKKRNVRR